MTEPVPELEPGGKIQIPSFKVLLTTKRKELLKAKVKAKKDNKRPVGQGAAQPGGGGGPRTPVGRGARSQQMQQQPRSAPGRIRDACY